MTEAATPGRYKIIPAAEEALALTKRHKRRAISILAPFALAFIIVEFLVMPPSLDLQGLTSLTATHQHPLLNQLLRLALTVPIIAMLLLAAGTFGLKRAAGQKAAFTVITENLGKLPHAIVTATLVLVPDYLFSAFLPGFGSLLGLMLGMAFMPSIYYVLDQDLDAFRAAGRSLRLVLSNLGQSLLAFGLTLLGMLASILTLGVGFLFLVPIAMTIGAAIYRQAEGLHAQYESLENQ